MLSVYDISAANTPGQPDAKNLYIGLRYNTRNGRLFFDALGASVGSSNKSIKPSQKVLAMQYCDAMGIQYNVQDKDLAI